MKKESKILLLAIIAVIMIIVILTIIITNQSMPNKYIGEWNWENSETKESIAIVNEKSKLILKENNTFELSKIKVINIIGLPNADYEYKYKGTYEYNSGEIQFTITETEKEQSYYKISDKIVKGYCSDNGISLKIIENVTDEKKEERYIEYKK